MLLLLLLRSWPLTCLVCHVQLRSAVLPGNSPSSWRTQVPQSVAAFKVQEFAEFARSKDQSKGLRTVFELPYAIDGDKVGNCTVKLLANKEDAWSKALKFMVTDLKFALKWVVRVHDQALAASLLPQLASSPGGSNVGSVAHRNTR